MIINLPGKINPLSYFIRKRIERQRNVNIMFTGDTGTGKTYSAISLGAGLHKDFHTPYICLTLQKVLEVVGQITRYPKEYKNKGITVLYEEPQEEQFVSRSTTIEAVSFTQLLSTFRSLGCILIVTTPKISQIHSYAKSYFDIWIETKRIDYKAKICRCSIKFGEWEEGNNEMTWSYPMVRVGNNYYQWTTVEFTYPPEELVSFYEQEKIRFQAMSYSYKIRRIETKRMSMDKKSTQLQKEQNEMMEYS